MAAFSGCSQQPDMVFAAYDTEQLSDLHQQQIQDMLGRLFGTPAYPHRRVPAEDQPEDGDLALVDSVDPGRLQRGAQVYNVRCAGCHGINGDGNGDAAAYLLPKPRDYRQGVFKFTSTPYGAKPARMDLVRTIRRGAKGTSMPAFAWMPEEDVQAVVDYVVLLSQRGEVGRLTAQIAEFDYDEDEEIEAIDFLDNLEQVQQSWSQAQGEIVEPVSAPPPYDDESILAGRKIFVAENCWKCHGMDAEGQTEWLSHEFIAEQEALPEEKRVQINRDAWGEVAPAANITAGMLHGGRRPIDVYRRIHTGINGTPMPAFAQSFADDPDKTWNLVHYVLSIIEGRDVAPEEAGESPTAEN